MISTLGVCKPGCSFNASRRNVSVAWIWSSCSSGDRIDISACFEAPGGGEGAHLAVLRILTSPLPSAFYNNLWAHGTQNSQKARKRVEGKQVRLKSVRVRVMGVIYYGWGMLYWKEGIMLSFL